jgi:hypothetical protein
VLVRNSNVRRDDNQSRAAYTKIAVSRLTNRKNKNSFRGRNNQRRSERISEWIEREAI